MSLSPTYLLSQKQNIQQSLQKICDRKTYTTYKFCCQSILFFTLCIMCTLSLLFCWLCVLWDGCQIWVVTLTNISVSTSNWTTCQRSSVMLIILMKISWQKGKVSTIKKRISQSHIIHNNFTLYFLPFHLMTGTLFCDMSFDFDPNPWFFVKRLSPLWRNRIRHESCFQNPYPIPILLVLYIVQCAFSVKGRSPQSCTETDFEMKTSNFVLFLLISVVSVHFQAIYDETIRCQA